MKASSSSSSSSSSDDQPKKYPVGHSDMNYHHHQPTGNHQGYPPSSVTGYPPTVGYPHGQPGYPPQYQGYPPNAYNYHPSGPYYNPQSESPAGSAFVRGFVVMFIILITLTCISSIIVWIVLRPATPEFRVDSLTVTNFNVSKANFTANWEANIMAYNPNHRLKVYFDRVQSFVYYDEDHLSSAAVDPMFLNTKAREEMKLKLATNSMDEHVVADWVLDDIVKERNGGSVTFNMRMLVFSTFKSGVWWTRHATLKVFCEDLKVDFIGNAMDGKLAAAKDEQCIVYYS
ncbi:NDR1/HIN1-like protein 12 [Ziziphus jujuba]|uniref:NDR1/HIN1-like protein 12 n=2 Tax=Ziziphus jujuba TaxID=326968 RepID=A0A6P4B914_ZIZJJ|nr:NDR1/HIN1-like protein 12 [Ziziphus jujuba]KAH7512242.1 hypothetical protein FEM48_Zijuj12G0069600 [Ziziphus jujuba var. spinosa]